MAQLTQDGKVGGARSQGLNRRCSLRRSRQRLAQSSARRHPGEIDAWLATRQSTILPPPAGTPLQNCICSALHMLRISSRNLTGNGPIGPIGGSATGGGAATATLTAAAPPRAARAVRQPAESSGAWPCRHCRACAPPGWTPAQRDIKSDWHAWRITARWALEGCRGGDAARCAAGAAAGAGDR